MGMTPTSRALRELIAAHRRELDAVMHKYGATNPRLFGSVARGDATQSSDIDILVSNDRNLWMVSGGVTSVGAPSRG